MLAGTRFTWYTMCLPVKKGRDEADKTYYIKGEKQ
jgi:hypothetical protein